MKQLKDLYLDVLTNGKERDTRTGKTLSVWKRSLEWDLRDGFPAVTSKQLQWKAVVGELLWFLSGSDTIKDLRRFTYGPDHDPSKWTIWSDDAARWGASMNHSDKNFVGALYPVQWRGDEEWKPDQIKNLISKIICSPEDRDLIVMAWNPHDIRRRLTALKPCHLGFQCYVEDGYLHLNWWQRSVDSFLGLPFNIASYALLTHLLASWTGLKPGRLSCDLGDTHIYMNHLDAINKYLANPLHELPELILPEGTDGLTSTLQLTALDFEGALRNYNHSGAIKAPLSVGKDNE